VQRKPLIALVDDDESIREALMSLLKSFGYRAVAFTCAEEFLSDDRRRKPACLIADVQMPGMSGLELHDRLRESGRAIPTILITAYPDPATRAQALRRGVRAYLSKPFREEALRASIRKALE